MTTAPSVALHSSGPMCSARSRGAMSPTPHDQNSLGFMGFSSGHTMTDYSSTTVNSADLHSDPLAHEECLYSSLRLPHRRVEPFIALGNENSSSTKADPKSNTRYKRGPFKNRELREQTAETRRMRSCIRCRIQRTRVRRPQLSLQGLWITLQAD